MADNVEHRDASRCCWIRILSVKVHIYPRIIMAHAQYIRFQSRFMSYFVFLANMHFTSYELRVTQHIRSHIFKFGYNVEMEQIKLSENTLYVVYAMRISTKIQWTHSQFSMIFLNACSER